MSLFAVGRMLEGSAKAIGAGAKGLAKAATYTPKNSIGRAGVSAARIGAVGGIGALYGAATTEGNMNDKLRGAVTGGLMAAAGGAALGAGMTKMGQRAASNVTKNIKKFATENFLPGVQKFTTHHLPGGGSYKHFKPGQNVITTPGWMASTASFVKKHPLGVAAGIGAASYMSGSKKHQPINEATIGQTPVPDTRYGVQDMAPIQSVQAQTQNKMLTYKSNTGFQASAEGLTQGLHASRHR
jgi:hypothetical protein